MLVLVVEKKLGLEQMGKSKCNVITASAWTGCLCKQALSAYRESFPACRDRHGYSHTPMLGDTVRLALRAFNPE